MKIFHAAFRILSATAFLLGSNLTFAQEFEYSKLPVVNPKPDFNGVDAASGSYSANSPITFNAPGASNLKVRSMFNGRKHSFSLNIYLLDKTYTPGYGDPTERHISVHLGGEDKLFTCGTVGDCTHVISDDGSKLTRANKDNFVFTDNKGNVYTFRPLAYNQLTPCNDLDGEIGCNAAVYEAFAYASTIVYVSGEKLTYDPVTEVITQSGQTFARDTIKSNLGYKLVLERPVASNYTGWGSYGNWYPYHIGTETPKMSLYSGAQLLSTIITAKTIVGKITTWTQKDDLNRTYTLTLEGGSVLACSESDDVIDNTPLLPIEEKSPGGVQAFIEYYKQVGGYYNGFYLQPSVGLPISVKKITRGGKVWQYDNQVGSKSVTDPNNKKRTVTHEWSRSGYSFGQSYCASEVVGTNITSYTDELFRKSEYFYPRNGWDSPLDTLDVAKFPEGNGYDYDYDARGNLRAITQLAKPGSAESNRVIFRADYPLICDNNNYKYCNKPSWVEKAKGYRTDYTYSATHGGVQTVTQPAQKNGVRPQTRYSYSSIDTGDGVIWRNTGISQCMQGASCTSTADEIKTTIAYLDKTFLPTSRTVAAGNGSISATENYTYNAAGLMTSSTDALGQTSYFIYDVIGRKIGEISADPDGTGPLVRLATRTTYNNDNNPTRIARGTVTGTDLTALNAMVESQYTVITYDNLGRKYSDTRYSNGQVFSLTQFSYDAWNRVICTAKRLNFSSVPQDACVLGSRSIDGYDRITKNEYDDAGQLVKVYQAYGTPIEQVYSEFEYSGNGKRTTVVDANRNKALLKYDGYDRQTHWYFPSKTKAAFTHSTTDFEQYGYDLNDNRITLRKRDGLIFTYEYDNLDRVFRKTVPESGFIAASHTQDIFYGYDNRGLELFSRFGSETGQGITQTWDIFGKPLTSASNLDGVSRSLTYKNNLKGVRTHVTHPDGQQFIYSHDNLYRLKSVDHSSVGVLASYTYDSKGQLDLMGGGIATDFGYDGVGRATSLVHDLAGAANDNTYNYGYNPVSQLLSLTTSNTNYIPVNGQQAQNYQVNGLNQYTNVNGVAFEYDANGNLTFDGQTRYSYDPENRLVKATNTSGALKAEFWYDPMGRLNKIQNTSTTTQFLYDGDELVAEFSGTSTTVAQRYVHGIAIDDPVAWFQGASVSTSTKRHLRSNHQGSIVAVSDSSGNMLHLPRYDNWGKPQSIQPLRFGYTGQAWISELGLWHYKARVYSPQLGRFLQTDPVGYEDQINLYAYVGNDPINKIDPTGENGAIPNLSQMQAKAYSSQLTTQAFRAAVVSAEYNAKESMKQISLVADTGAVTALAFGQVEIATPLSAISTIASVTGNSIDFTSNTDFISKSNEAALAEGTGLAAGKAASNMAEALGEGIGLMGAKGKIVEQIIDATTEKISQDVSDSVKEGYLKTPTESCPSGKTPC